MGWHLHHTIIVTAWDEDRLKKAHTKASEIFPYCVSPITLGQANGYASFFIAPDGSKEGWDTSNEYEEQRSSFISWLKSDEAENLYLDWVFIQFGGDEGDSLTKIKDHGDL